MSISELLKSIAPSLLSKIRGKRQETSTRDQRQIVKQAEHIESIVDKLGYDIELKERAGKEKRKEKHSKQ